MLVLKKKQDHNCSVYLKMNHRESYVVNLAPALSGSRIKTHPNE